MIAVGRSWVGKVRSRNEDVAVFRADLQLIAVADGVGGHIAGHIASRLAMDELVDVVESDGVSQDSLRKGFDKANSTVVERTERQTELRGMSTTLVTACIAEDSVIFGHLGDSRGYRLRGGCLEQLTKDHSVVQEFVDRGEMSSDQAMFSPMRNIITKAIGLSVAVDPTFTQHDLQKDDVFLVCSDGLSDFVIHREIEEILNGTLADLPAGVTKLISTADKRGSTDNISVALAKI